LFTLLPDARDFVAAIGSERLQDVIENTCTSLMHNALSPHLREIATLIAEGLLRLRRRMEDHSAGPAGPDPTPTESSLHFPAHPSVDQATTSWSKI
jgi:hypothetical protein